MSAIIQDNGTQEQSHKIISKKCIIPNPVAWDIFMVWGAVFIKIQIFRNLRSSRGGSRKYIGTYFFVLAIRLIRDKYDAQRYSTIFRRISLRVICFICIWICLSVNVLSPLLDRTGARKRIFEYIVPASKFRRGQEANIYISSPQLKISKT